MKKERTLKSDEFAVRVVAVAIFGSFTLYTLYLIACIYIEHADVRLAAALALGVPVVSYYFVKWGHELYISLKERRLK